MAEMMDAEMADDDQVPSGVAIGKESSTANSKSKTLLPPTTLPKPIPYTFDLAHLLAMDPSPLPPQPTNAELDANARSGAQALINQLFTTCAFTSTSEGVSVALPAAWTALPREKSVPAEKAQTTWERFAAKKGIRPKRRDERARMVYDDAAADWVPRWGYKGKNKDGDADWLVEVDKDKETRTGEPGDKRKEGRDERRERVKRNERRMRANERRSGKGA